MQDSSRQADKARLRERRQAAVATTRDLGLPDAAAPTVLRVMRSGQPAVMGSGLVAAESSAQRPKDQQ